MSALPTNDLRSEAKEYQRDRNHNAKWARGSRSAYGKKCDHVLSPPHDACPDCATRPQHRDSDRRNGTVIKYPGSKNPTSQRATLVRKAFRNEVVDATLGSVSNVSDSSSEEDVRDASAAPVPDADVLYSFDAPSGPGRGADILSHAINKAVQRYENKETEKLVKEYDLVEDGKDTGDGYVADADEDDFEVIDYSHLK